MDAVPICAGKPPALWLIAAIAWSRKRIDQRPEFGATSVAAVCIAEPDRAVGSPAPSCFLQLSERRWL